MSKMSKNFLAGFISVFILCTASYASDWTGYFAVDWDAVGDYTSEKLDDVSQFFSGLFGHDDKKTVSSPDENEKLPPYLASDWDKLTDSLSDALQLRDKHEKLPKSSWLPFTEDQKSNAEKINALLDIALKILINGEAGDMRREAIELRSKLAKQRIELDDLRNKRINAPESSYLFWELTRGKADKKIAELEKEIKDGENRIKSVNSKLTESLKEIGLELDETQIDILLNSVTGDDLMKNSIVFSNVKIVVEKLEELSQNETNSFEITRRYTGMYLVLNDLLIHTQEELVRKIDNEYKPELALIIKEAEKLRKDALTKSNQNVYSKAQRESFAANAKSNAITVQVANLYRELLESQRLSTSESIKSLKLNRDLAENTYRTVRSSGELRGLIHSGLSLFDSIGTLSMPELKIFESGAMRLEFDEINRRLKK